MKITVVLAFPFTLKKKLVSINALQKFTALSLIIVQFQACQFGDEVKVFYKVLGTIENNMNCFIR